MVSDSFIGNTPSLLSSQWAGYNTLQATLEVYGINAAFTSSENHPQIADLQALATNLSLYTDQPVTDFYQTTSTNSAQTVSWTSYNRLAQQLYQAQLDFYDTYSNTCIINDQTQYLFDQAEATIELRDDVEFLQQRDSLNTIVKTVYRDYRTEGGLLDQATWLARAADPGQTEYSPDRGGWHDYTTRNEICPAAWQCSETEIQDQLLRYAVPGRDPADPVYNTATTTVIDPRNGLRAGDVRTDVSKDGLSIVNRTLSNHLLHDGQITRLIEQDENGAWYVVTRGIGNNVFVETEFPCNLCATVNSWQGEQIFNYVDELMRANIANHRGITP